MRGVGGHLGLFPRWFGDPTPSLVEEARTIDLLDRDVFVFVMPVAIAPALVFGFVVFRFYNPVIQGSAGLRNLFE